MSFNQIVNERATNFGYKLISRAGSGAFGTVFKATNSNGQVVALKIIPKKGDEDIINATRNEIIVLKGLSASGCTRYVACYHGYKEDQDYFYIEMEYVEGIRLNEYIDHLRKVTSQSELHLQILRIAREVSEGLQFCHSKNIIHNDIKPENIMITPEGRTKIVDFGVSCQAINRVCTTAAGTAQYASPEFILSLNQGHPVKDESGDMWALGVSLYYLIMKRYPFNGSTRSEIFGKILETPTDTLPFDTTIPLLQRVVMGLLNDNGDKRFRADQVITLINADIGSIPLNQLKEVKMSVPRKINRVQLSEIANIMLF